LANGLVRRAACHPMFCARVARAEARITFASTVATAGGTAL
jgi:hypothetical protein